MQAAQDIAQRALPNVVYTPRVVITTEVELSTLANIYRHVIDCGNRNAAGVSSTNGGDAKERSKDDSSAKTRIL